MKNEPLEPSETIDALTRTLAGVDGARRVGWAKYYDTDAKLEADRKTLISHIGSMVGLTEIVLPGSTENRPGVLNNLHEFAEAVIAEADEFTAYRRGLKKAPRLYGKIFGPVESDTTFDGKTVHTEGDEFLARCGKCNRVIAKVTGGSGSFESKCHRCRSVNTVTW